MKHNSDDSWIWNLPDDYCLVFNSPSATAYNAAILLKVVSVSIN